MNHAIEKLKARRKALDEKIKALEKADREAAREKALRILTESGLLDLPEVELTQKLAALKGKAE